MPAADAPAKQPIKCERPGCHVQFVPYRSTSKYCSARCKKVVAAYKHALAGGAR